MAQAARPVELSLMRPPPEEPASDAEIPWSLELEEDQVRRRLAWARERGHPRYLWPELEAGALDRALRDLEGVARDVLGGRRPSLEAPTRPHARALGIAAFTAGMGALVGRWIEDRRVEAGALPSRLFATHLAHGRLRARRLASVRERACRALADAGAPPVVVKSGHTSAVYFPEPGARPSVDVDIVVPRGSLAVAEAGLAAAGFELAHRQHRPPKSDWLAPGAARLPRSLEMLHADGQYAVDLHVSLERNFLGVRRLDPAPNPAAAARPDPRIPAPASVLRQPVLLVYHALHASEGLDHLTLVRLVELVLMVRRDREEGRLDWDGVMALLRETGEPGFAYPALALAERLAPGTMDAGVLKEVADAAPPRLRAVVDGLAPWQAQRFEVLSLRERFLWCRTPMDHARRLAHMAFPAPAGRSPRRLAAMYLDRVRRLVRGKIALRGPGEG